MTPLTPQRHESPKTSLSITIKNQIGSFHKVIAAFSLRDINIIKIDSRPSNRSISLTKTWEYVVFIDIDGSVTDERVERAISNLNEFCKVDVLGSYPRFFFQEAALGIVGL